MNHHNHFRRFPINYKQASKYHDSESYFIQEEDKLVQTMIKDDTLINIKGMLNETDKEWFIN